MILKHPWLLAFPNEKGGAGKTTGCVSVGGGYAARGLSVCVVDTDANATATRWLIGFPRVATKLGLDLTKPHKQPEVLRQFYCPEPIPTTVNGMSLTRPLASQIREHVIELRDSGTFDVILIDLPGSRDREVLKAMMISDLSIIVMAPQEAAYTGAVSAVSDITELNNDTGLSLKCRVLITNIKQVAAPASQGAILGMIETSRMPVFASRLMQRGPFEEIGLTMKPPHFSQGNADSVGKCVAEIDGVLNEIDALLSPEQKATGSLLRSA